MIAFAGRFFTEGLKTRTWDGENGRAGQRCGRHSNEKVARLHSYPLSRKGRHVPDNLSCEVSVELPGGHYVNRRVGQQKDASAPRGQSQTSATYTSRRVTTGRRPVERSV